MGAAAAATPSGCLPGPRPPVGGWDSVSLSTEAAQGEEAFPIEGHAGPHPQSQPHLP